LTSKYRRKVDERKIRRQTQSLKRKNDLFGKYNLTLSRMSKQEKGD
jgi:hypothetical protein